MFISNCLAIDFSWGVFFWLVLSDMITISKDAAELFLNLIIKPSSLIYTYIEVEICLT
jgi:hypothetical protein